MVCVYPLGDGRKGEVLGGFIEEIMKGDNTRIVLKDNVKEEVK